MPLNEYIYVDQRRLQSYHEQIKVNRRPRKVPLWKASLNLLGPAVEVTEAVAPAKETSTHEKIQALLAYVDLESTLVPYEALQKAPFVVQSLAAAKVHLPPKPGLNFGGINVWISDTDLWQKPAPISDGSPAAASDARGLLLVEDFPRDDASEGGDWCWDRSAWTALVRFLGEMAPEFEKTVLGDVGRQELLGGWGSHRSLITPTEFFDRIGAQFHPKREITSLYRVRHFISDTSQMVGYPIVITDGPLYRHEQR